MIDLKIIKDDPDRIKAEVRKRGMDVDVDALVKLDADRRKLQAEFDELRSEQKGTKDAKAGKALKENLKKLDAKKLKNTESFYELYLQLPNFTADDVPGKEDKEERHGPVKKPNLKSPKPHYEIPGIKPLIDFERGAKVSGNRFWYLKGPLVDLEFALIRYAFDFYREKGYELMRPPSIVRGRAMRGTGFFPAEKNEIYALEGLEEHEVHDVNEVGETHGIELYKQYLSGTAEVPLASYHAGEKLDELPVKYAGFAPAYRREAGSYGKDTKGIMRGHEFDKVELFVFADPKESWKEHDRIQKDAELFWDSLEVPYRVLNIAAVELGAPNAKKYDIEAWLPGGDRYMEVASNSNDTDFQARRLNVKHGSELVHTLNNTACAVGRAIIAIVENHQNEDGSVDMPAVLYPKYLPFKRIEQDGTTT